MSNLTNEHTHKGKEQTAMQELIEFIEKNYDWFVVHSPEYGVVPKILEKAQSLLPKERQGYIDAVDDTNNAYTHYVENPHNPHPISGEDYFNNKFNQ